jgi:hypothetical protein
MNKIAIQLAGQVRDWENSYYDWEDFKSNLEKKDFDIDFHICTWEDEYTKECNFDFIETVNLVPINTEMISFNVKPTVGTKEYKMNPIRRDQTPLGMIPFSYLQYWGSRYRRLYQKQNKIEYDFIILARPDIYYHNAEDFAKLFSEDWETTNPRLNFKNSHFTIFMPQGILNSVDRHMPRVSNDLLFMGTEESINLFSNGFLHCYLQTSKSFISTHHTLPAMVCMKTNLHDRSMMRYKNPLVRLH